MKSNLLPIAKEGWKYILTSFALFLLFSIFDWDFLATLTFITTALLLFFFRNPERELSALQENSFVAPSDGVVRSIEEIYEGEYLYKIEIEGSYLDVALLRMPAVAKVLSVTNYKGTRVSAESSLFSSLNEQSSLLFEDSTKNRFMMNFKLKNSFSGLEVDLIEAQKLNKAARFGFMLHGVTTLYLPSNFRLNIQEGNRVKAAESLIGYFS
jgi:phosphatidylserine decarboxylase